MISFYGIEKADQWDKIVRSFREYDFYYLSGYAKSCSIHEQTDIYLVYYEADHLRGINVVARRDIAKAGALKGVISENRYYDLATPYGYGGWILEGDGDISQLDREYTDWCLKNNIVSEFVRVHPVIANERYMKDFYDIVPCGSAVVIDCSSFDRFLERLPQKTKNMIKKAERNGLRVVSGKSEEKYREFLNIYRQTMERVNADQEYFFSKEYFDCLLNELKDESEIISVMNGEGEIVSSCFCLGTNGYCTLHLGGTKSEYLKMAAGNLMYYGAIKAASQKGLKRVNLGSGVGFREDSLFCFKKSFTKNEPIPHYFGNKIFDMDAYHMLMGLRKTAENTGYFPEYRG